MNVDYRLSTEQKEKEKEQQENQFIRFKNTIGVRVAYLGRFFINQTNPSPSPKWFDFRFQSMSIHFRSKILIFLYISIKLFIIFVH